VVDLSQKEQSDDVITSSDVKRRTSYQNWHSSSNGEGYIALERASFQSMGQSCNLSNYIPEYVIRQFEFNLFLITSQSSDLPLRLDK